jgi:hypothetical protein
LGSVLATAGDGPQGSVFAAVVGFAMLLRSRVYAGCMQTAALIVAGAASLSASFLHSVESWSGYRLLLGLVAIAAGAMAFGLGRAAGSAPCSPVARRFVDGAERVVLAAIVPLGCWAGGLYDAARGPLALLGCPLQLT